MAEGLWEEDKNNSRMKVTRMIKIVFNDSAAGFLKVAQRYGKGPYREGAVSVLKKGSLRLSRRLWKEIFSTGVSGESFYKR